ncbi:MAG TPA: hypothetical protein VMV61_11610 [Patescibacteria group bacterium]|nr:hypothetical protein [Patescibacteria group bacterium]
MKLYAGRTTSSVGMRGDGIPVCHNRRSAAERIEPVARTQEQYRALTRE